MLINENKLFYALYNLRLVRASPCCRAFHSETLGSIGKSRLLHLSNMSGYLDVFLDMLGTYVCSPHWSLRSGQGHERTTLSTPRLRSAAFNLRDNTTTLRGWSQIYLLVAQLVVVHVLPRRPSASTSWSTRVCHWSYRQALQQGSLISRTMRKERHQREPWMWSYAIVKYPCRFGSLHVYYAICNQTQNFVRVHPLRNSSCTCP